MHMCTAHYMYIVAVIIPVSYNRTVAEKKTYSCLDFLFVLF